MDTLAVAESAVNALSTHLTDLGASLPDPGDGAEARVGDAGLRELSASQFAEA